MPMARENRLNRQARRLNQTLQIVAGAQLTVQQTSGPIPDPETLHRYDQISPGYSNRIITMAEEESAHRRGMERKIVDAQTADIKTQRIEVRWGQISALIVATTGIGCGTYAMTHGAQIAGSVLSGGTLVSLVGAFLWRQKREPERELDAQRSVHDGEIAPPPLLNKEE
jgi:uncharacterized membrane protein